jgi:hypothetical protein
MTSPAEMTKGKLHFRERLLLDGSLFATTVDESCAFPFVISTEAKRSGEICGLSGPYFGNVQL